MPKVLFLDCVHPLIEDELTLAGYQCDLFFNKPKEEIKKIISSYEGIIIRSRITLDEDILSKASSLKWIGRVGAGMENIDVPYASDHGIACFNSPEGNRDAVGEHTLGMLLSLFNNILRADRQVRQGIWDREGNRGLEIKGKTIGIIGYGNMGSAFAQRLRGFECRVISYDKYKFDYSDAFTTETDMQEIFSKADILSLHIPLTEETHHLVNSGYLSKFEKNIWLINTSRGPVVKTADLVEALKSGKIRGAALDVLEDETSSFEKITGSSSPEFSYLTSCDNVLLTPHIAGWTVESNYKLARVLVNKIINAFSTGSD